MRSTTPALRGPRATLVALVLVALAPSSAQALASLTADGTCSASAQYHISAGQERAINTPCTVNRGNTPDEITASGLAVASGLTDITGMSMFSASASFGALLIDSYVFARVNPDWLRYSPGSYARGTGSTTASASFQDTLTLDPTHLGSTNTVDVAVSGMIEVGTQSAHASGSVSFAIRLNGTSIYSIDTSSDRNDGHNPFSFSFTASATDVIDVVAWASAHTEVNLVGIFPLDGGADGGDNLTSLAVNINTIGTAARLIAESGHDYASSAIAPVPEPATWALMAAGLLGIGANSARRRKAAALNVG